MNSVTSNAVARAIFKNTAFENINGATFVCNQVTLTDVTVDAKYIPLSNNNGKIGILFGRATGVIPSGSPEDMSFHIGIPEQYTVIGASLQVSNYSNPLVYIAYTSGLQDFWVSKASNGWIIIDFMTIAQKA